MKKVAAVVVTYNRKKLLKECLIALKKLNYEGLDIIIVDNFSTDGTYDEIKCLIDDKVFYFNTGKNLGGAGGFAYGCNKAYMKNYDYCWLMDDDTIVEPNALSSLLFKASCLDDNFSFLASVVKFTDGNIAIPNCQVVDKSAIKDIDAVCNKLLLIKQSTFVSCFINCSVGKKVGLPIKEMFIYGDDTNYTYRLSQEKKGYLDLDSFVIHKMTSNLSNSLLGCEKNRIKRWTYGFRNNVYNSKIRGRALYTIFIYNPAYALKVLLKSKSKRLSRFFVVIKGTILGLFFRPRIIKHYDDNIKW